MVDLEGQGWDIGLKDVGMEPRGRKGMSLEGEQRLSDRAQGNDPEVWMDNGGRTKLTHQELVEHPEGVVITATAEGGKRTKAASMTWHRRLGHPSFKMVVVLAQSGTSGVVITDLLVKIPGRGACAARVAEKSVHLTHKEGRGRASERVS